MLADLFRVDLIFPVNWVCNLYEIVIKFQLTAWQFHLYEWSHDCK